MRRKRYLQVSCCSGEKYFDPRPLLLRLRALLRAGSAGCRRAGHRAHVHPHRRSTSLHASGPRSCAGGFDHDSHGAGSHRAFLCGEGEGGQTLRHGRGARRTPHSELTHLLQVRILPGQPHPIWRRPAADHLPRRTWLAYTAGQTGSEAPQDRRAARLRLYPHLEEGGNLLRRRRCGISAAGNLQAATPSGGQTHPGGHP